jgi:hypothetical protein
LYVPAPKPVIVVLVVEPAIAPGLIVQFPSGKPVNTTLPVGTAQVGCVIVPTVGADTGGLSTILAALLKVLVELQISTVFNPEIYCATFVGYGDVVKLNVRLAVEFAVKATELVMRRRHTLVPGAVVLKIDPDPAPGAGFGVSLMVFVA